LTFLDIGIEKYFPQQLFAQPYKKKRNRKSLQEEEKDYNKKHAKKRRIVIENIPHLQIEKIQNTCTEMYLETN
jgi:hypothetical protein